MFFDDKFKVILNVHDPSDQYDPSGKSNSSFQVGADILNLLLVCGDLMFFPGVANT